MTLLRMERCKGASEVRGSEAFHPEKLARTGKEGQQRHLVTGTDDLNRRKDVQLTPSGAGTN